MIVGSQRHLGGISQPMGTVSAVALALSLLAGGAQTPDPLGGSVQGLIASQIIIAFLLGTFILSQPAIRFRIVPRRARHDHAHAEAMRQFQVQGIDKTERRTGVLIVASAAERYVEVVAEHFPPGALKRDELPDKLLEI